MSRPPPPAWYYRQSGVVPFRPAADGPEILLITSRSRGRWIIPKGVVEPDMTPADSALNEAFEEAGLKGCVVGPALGSFTYAKWEGTCTVEVFAMAVDTVCDDWPERKERKRRWLALAEAADLADDAAVGDLIRQLGARLRA